MAKAKLTREDREWQLRQLMRTTTGQGEVSRLFAACFPEEVVPPIGISHIQTILDHEYSPRPPKA